MKKINKWILAAIAAAVLAVAAICLLPGLTGNMRAYGLLNAFLQREELALELALELQTGEENLRFDATVEKYPVAGHSVTAVTREGSSLYFSGGALFLQDGTVYTMQNQQGDYSTMLELMLETLAGEGITESDGIYTFTAVGDRARSILKEMLGEVIPETEGLTAELVTENDAIRQIRLEIRGAAQLRVQLTVRELGQISLPEPVQSRIEAGDFSGTDISGHLSQLVQGLGEFGQRETMAASGSLTAELGFLPFSHDVTFYSWKVNGNSLLCMDTGLVKRFYSDAAVFDANGKLVAERGELLTAQQTLDMVWQLAAQGQITFGRSEESYTCVLSPSAEVMELFAHTLVPDTVDMDIAFHTGSVGLQVEEGKLLTIYVRVSGTTKVLLFDTDVALELMLHPVETEELPPQAVVDALLPEGE